MPVDWAPFVELVHRHQHFLLTTHVRPDGDGLGSILGLAEALRQLGKQVQMTVASVLPPRYDFLIAGEGIDRFKPPGDAYRSADAVVVLDTGTWNQLGDFGPFLKTLAADRAVIDHHQTQDDLGALRLVDTTAEATGRLVFEAVTALGTPLTAKAANALFVALAMDTGWFRFSNTTAATFALAAALVRAGADCDYLYDQLYERTSLARLKLTGLLLERMRVAASGQVAYSEIHRGDYERTRALPQDTEDLVNFTRSIDGVEVGLLFMEQPRGGVKVSFRSRGRIDVERLAKSFGGGGHRAASGATVQAPLEEVRARVLAAVETVLDPAR
jgi:phosphoesterase RecJ-like protein